LSAILLIPAINNHLVLTAAIYSQLLIEGQK